MLIRKEITPEQARVAMEHGEFGEDVTGAGPNVAVVLTQGWCPQWHFLNRGLMQLERNGKPEDRNVHVYVLVYDEVDYFHEFMRFKEAVWRNYSVPYVRYYRNGELRDSSNYVSPQAFLSRFEN